MTKILVTGGAGFIGSHVVDELLSRNHRVVVLDDLSTGKLENLPQENPHLEIIEGSILDVNRVSAAMQGCDVVIHLAAIASVQASVDNPQATHNVNFDGTLLLLEEAKRLGMKRFLFASSAAVYGDATKGAISEEAPLSPMTPYAIDKLASEYYLRHFYRTFGIAFTAFRFFNVYGPRQNPSSPYSGVISIFAAKAHAGNVLEIFGDGRQTRDFIYAKDVANVLVNSIEKEAMYGQTINVGSGASVSLLDIIEKISIILNKKLEVKHLDARSGDIKHSLANVAKLHLFYNAEYSTTSLLDGLSATISK